MTRKKELVEKQGEGVYASRMDGRSGHNPHMYDGGCSRLMGIVSENGKRPHKKNGVLQKQN